MFWLTLLLVWAAASIVVAVVWGKVVQLSEDCSDDGPGAAPTSALDSSTESPPRDGPHRSPHR